MMQGIGSNWGLAQQHKTNAALARANARVTRAKGEALKTQYETIAQRTEHDNKVRLEQAADKIADTWRKGSMARGALVAQRGASGFTEQGSASMPEKSLLSQIEDQADAIAYASSLQDAAARYNAAMYRVSGNIAQRYAEADAGYLDAQASLYDSMARGANRAGNVTAAVGFPSMVAGAIIGGYFGGPQGAMAGAQMGGRVGNMVGGVYGAGQMGSYTNMKGMSDEQSYTFGNEFGNSLFQLSGGNVGFQSNDSFANALGSWLKS